MGHPRGQTRTRCIGPPRGRARRTHCPRDPMRVCVVLIAAVLGLILLAAGSQGQARQGQRAVPSPQWEKEAFRCFEGIASCRIGKKLSAGGIGDVFLVDIKASTWEQKKLPEHVTSKIWQAGGML